MKKSKTKCLIIFAISILLSFCINLANSYAGKINVTEEDKTLPGLFDIPSLRIFGFADIGYNIKVTDNQDSNMFSLGGLSLFITSQIADKVSFLFEAEFHSEDGGNHLEFDPERANIKYSISDMFNIKVGRLHTPVGYWSQAFHHGTWLQTSITRPVIYFWEDEDGGFLPIHSFGVELLGIFEFKDFDLEYNFNILNGRGKTITEIQIIEDKNDSKAMNFLLSLEPFFINELVLGVNFYFDTIPPDPGDPARINRIEERIIGGYVTYNHGGLELIGEVFNIYHDDKTSNNDFNTLGLYFQTAYKMNKFTPYYRFDFLDFGNGDPYFNPNDIDQHKHTAGLRWEIFNWNALKFEYSYSDKERIDAEHEFAFNISFVF